MSAFSAIPSPKLGLLAPKTATVSSGDAATVALTPTGGAHIAAWRIKRLAASAGVLHYRSDGTAASGTGDYQLTSTDPDSGWIWSSDASASIYAASGDVVYEIARLGA